jgi:hypothetical protein
MRDDQQTKYTSPTEFVQMVDFDVHFVARAFIGSSLGAGEKNDDTESSHCL